MNNIANLGQHQQMTVEQDEAKNVVLRTTNSNTSFVLSPEEALDLLHWLYAQQDLLIAVAQDKEPTGKLDS